MRDQINNLNKLKAKAEKERNTTALGLEDIQNTLVNKQKERFVLEKQGKQVQAQTFDSQARQDNIQQSLNETDDPEKKMALENCDLVHQLEEEERLAVQVSKDAASKTTQLEDTK